jgi:hypothetical protein
MAIVKRMIPIPPSHWLIARHKSRDLGMTVTSAMTVEPVVVKPDTASKKPSAGPRTPVTK